MRKRSRRFAASLAAGTLIAALPSAVLGHVHLVSTTPEAGTNLDQPPDEVVIEFDGELEPDRSSFTVRDANGAEVGIGEVDLSVADRDVLRGDVAITEPGVYEIEYSVVGLDGHEVTGEFSFGFQATEAVPAPPHDDHPDTAVAAVTGLGVGAVLVAAGTNLLLAAGLLALAGARRPGRAPDRDGTPLASPPSATRADHPKREP